MKIRACFVLVLVLALSCLAGTARADGTLGPDLSTFAILGGAGVTVAGTGSVITGSIGAYPTTSITGVIPTNFNISDGTVQSGGSTALAAQGELGSALTSLEGMGPGTTESTLGGLSLAPGVYSSGSTMNLTGTLTLNGNGTANEVWVFLVGSSLTTASDSVVNITNAGTGASVYWVMESASATLGQDSTFEGNILASQSITLGTGVTDCGRLLAQVASVTLAGTDTIGTDGTSSACSGNLASTNGLNGGGSLAPTPEPGTFALLLSGLLPIGLLALRKSRPGLLNNCVEAV